MGDTKAKINLVEGTIELEGKEDFVRAYLDEFKELIKSTHVSTANEVISSKKSTPKKVTKKNKTDTKTATSKKTTQKIAIERFDIHGNDKIPSLTGFLDEKKPGTGNGNIISVVGYYITETLDNETFSEGQIEYAYKMLKLKRPKHLHQIMINEKNKRDLFEPDADNNTLWSLTRSGEIFVSDLLPES